MSTTDHPDTDAQSHEVTAHEMTSDEPTSGKAGVSVASFDDPRLQPYAKHPARAEKVVAAFLAIGLLGCAAYGGLYWVGGQAQLEAIFLGGGLFCIGFGLTAWGKYLLPRGPFEEERHQMASSEVERQAMTSTITDRAGAVVRRRFLGGLLAGALGIFGFVLGLPLLRSLGPKPGTGSDANPASSMFHTDWRRGRRLVQVDGTPVNANALEDGDFITVFPEGFQDKETSAQDQTVLIRYKTRDITTMPGREGWAPKGFLAYSKVCTHAGCPVGLYQHATAQLLCPCHQSLFNILDGAEPQFGPAPRPLPQLPLMIDEDGWLRAQADYDEPIGPGFWERTSS